MDKDMNSVYDNGHRKLVAEAKSKINFDDNSRAVGLGVLIDSCISFTFTGDGFIVTKKHQDLLGQADVRYQVL